jgi:hypothetical protein
MRGPHFPKSHKTHRLRGIDVSDDVTWYGGILEFLKKHRYYTESQKKIREKGKQENIRRFLRKLQDIEKQK